MTTPNYIELLGLAKVAKRSKNLQTFQRECMKLQSRADHFGLSTEEFRSYCDSAWRMNYWVTSFIAIARRVSNDRAVCDANTKIAELLSGNFDHLDFEVAKLCFEATHRIEFSESDSDEYLQLTIAEFIEGFVDSTDRLDALFVTERFLMFKHVLESAILERYDTGNSH